MSIVGPALMKGSRNTVVISPLQALADDLMKQCHKLGLDSTAYTPRCQQRSKVTIAVTETAGQPEFRKYICQRSTLEEKLDRVVWDEAQMLVTDVDYRESIISSRLLQLAVQMVFITALVPHGWKKSWQE